MSRLESEAESLAGQGVTTIDASALAHCLGSSPELGPLIRHWAELPETIRRGILAMCADFVL